MFSRLKFLALTKEQQHKKCAEWLRAYYQMSLWMGLPLLEEGFEALSNRYHEHAQSASISLNERDFLIHTQDRSSTTPFLPHAIYLDHLRSGHNVGSILRSTEAFRLGSLYFCDKTPFIDNKKVCDAAMGCEKWVTCHRGVPLASLPGPKIALETAEGAHSLFTYRFPRECTLIVGNEEYGVSKASLQLADDVVQIPLVGCKNSLNVSNAFAIAAAFIAAQQRSC